MKPGEVFITPSTPTTFISLTPIASITSDRPFSSLLPIPPIASVTSVSSF